MSSIVLDSLVKFTDVMSECVAPAFPLMFLVKTPNHSKCELYHFVVSGAVQ